MLTGGGDTQWDQERFATKLGARAGAKVGTRA